MAIEKLEGSKVKITFAVTKEQFAAALDKAFEVKKNEVEIKGWRKGNITRGIYEKNYGVESLYSEAVMQIADEMYPNAVKENNIVVVGQPELDIDFTKITVDSDFEFAIIVPVYPTVTLGKYKGLEVKAKDVTVSDDEVNDAIEALLNKNAIIVPKEEGTLQLGDTAVFDFEGYKDGVAFPGGTAENYELEIGSGNFIPGFEEQMVGMTIKEEKTITVTFPEGYQEPSLAGQPADFKIKLNEMKTKEKPALDNDFVKELNYENVSNVEELKTYILNDIQNRKDESETNRLTEELITEACQRAKFEIPEAMINNALEDEIKDFERNIQAQYNLKLEDFKKLANIDETEFTNNLKQRAVKRLNETIVLEAIIREEKITPSDEDFAKMYEEIGLANKITAEEAKSKLNPLDVAFHLNIKKAIDLLIENANLK